MLGTGVLILANATFIWQKTATPFGMFLGCSFAGIHLGMTHGLLLGMIGSYFPTGKTFNTIIILYYRKLFNLGLFLVIL